MKRFIFITIAYLCLCVTKVHAYNFKVDGIYYNKLTTNTAEVTYKDSNYNSYSGSITIPSSVTYNNVTYTVTKIGENAFRKCSKLTAVTIPSSVTIIGNYAFYYCQYMRSFTIPSSVTSIGEYAFSYSGLNSVNIPESVTSIGARAFSDNSLTSVTIPSSVTSIEKGTFCYNALLESVTFTIPSSVTSIGEMAFYDCNKLASINIPESVTSIGDNAFNSCRKLASINIPEGVTSIGEGAFYYSGLTSVTIPSSVTSINKLTFTECSDLTSVTFTLPSSVTSIGDYAFSNCSSLTSITVPDGVTTLGARAFQLCRSLTTATIPSSVVSIGEMAFINCSVLTSVISEIETPFKFGSDAFSGISDVCTLTVPIGTRDTYITKGWTEEIFKGGIVYPTPSSLLRDGETYNVLTSANHLNPTYVRSFSEAVVNSMQAWFIPFDYTITTDDATNFDFFKIHFIAASGVSGTIVDDTNVFLYIQPMSVGETLQGNRPYLVKAKSSVTDYEFHAEDVTLMAIDTSSRMTTQTAKYTYDFYGTYDTFAATQPYDWMAMSRSGLICWNATAAAQLGSYRWYLKVTPKDGFDDYTKLRISIVDDENQGEATAVLNVENNTHLVSIFNTSGQSTKEMNRGLNIVRMSDGTTRKVFVK